MGAPETLPDLQYQKPDGSPFTRLEMEQQMRDVWPKVYWLRIKANKIYGLPKQPSFDMKEAVLRHWVLDEMARRGQIVGDQVGVNVQSYNDDNEQRQFIQRLTAMIQAGQAFAPKEGEGVDMSNLPQQPPVPANGQMAPQQFAPPAPPMGVPQNYAPPAGPPGFAPPAPPFAPPGMAPPPPAQGFAPPAQGFAPLPAQGFAPLPAQGFAPGGPPQGFQPAAPPQFAPPPGMAPPQQGAPMMPPGYAPPSGPPGYAPQAAPQQQMAAPQQAAPAPAGGRGRGRKAAGDGQPAAVPPAAPVPPMGAQPGYAPPPQQTAPGFPPLPQGGFPGFGQPQQAPQQQSFAPQQPTPQAAPQQSVGTDLGPVLAKLDQLAGLVTQQAQIIGGLQRQITVLSMGAALTLRAAHSRQGAPDMESILKEIGVQLPQ